MGDLFVNVKASEKIGVIRFPFGIGILLYSNGSEVIFFLAARARRLWIGQMAYLIDQRYCILTNDKSSRFSFCLLQNGDSEFWDAFLGVTENNKLVTVALLLIFDCEEAEEIFWHAKSIKSEGRNFSEDIGFSIIIMLLLLLELYRSLYESHFVFLLLNKSRDQLHIPKDSTVSYATRIFNVSHSKSHYNYSTNCHIGFRVSLSLPLLLLTPFLPLFSRPPILSPSLFLLFPHFTPLSFTHELT